MTKYGGVTWKPATVLTKYIQNDENNETQSLVVKKTGLKLKMKLKIKVNQAQINRNFNSAKLWRLILIWLWRLRPI